MTNQDIRHRAYEIAKLISDGSIKRSDFIDQPGLIHEVAACMKHVLNLLAESEADGAGLEAEFDDFKKAQIEHNAKRNEVVKNQNKKIKRRDEKIKELEAACEEINADFDVLSRQVADEKKVEVTESRLLGSTPEVPMRSDNYGPSLLRSTIGAIQELRRIAKQHDK